MESLRNGYYLVRYAEYDLVIKVKDGKALRCQVSDGCLIGFSQGLIPDIADEDVIYCWAIHHKEFDKYFIQFLNQWSDD